MTKEKTQEALKFINREYRCSNCYKLFFKGSLKQAYIEIRCKHCKKTQIINASEIDLASKIAVNKA